MKTKSDSGLIILERICELKIGGLIGLLMGKSSLQKEEFIRFLIVDENGLKNAETEIESLALSTIDQIEARTVLPGGTIIYANKDKDIEIFKIGELNKKESGYLVGKIKFPQPQVGAILDLHYKYSANVLVFGWSENLVNPDKPIKKLKIKFIITDTMSRWQVVALNTSKADVLKLVKNNEIELNLENIPAGKEEPFSPPPIYYQPYLIAFSNLSADEKLKGVPSNWNEESACDDMWLPVFKDIDKISFKPYWVGFLKEFENERKEFIKDGGNFYELEESNLLSLKVEDRAKKIVEFVQNKIKMAVPDKIVTITKKTLKPSLVNSLKNRFKNSEEVTYFISYLFDKYQVPYEKGVIFNRMKNRFSPFITNGHMFDPIYALKILDENSQPKFIVGNINFPFGALPISHQLSVFLFLKENDTLKFEITPENKKGIDYQKIKYELTLNDDQTMSGKVLLEKRGCHINTILYHLQQEQIESKDSKKEKNKNVKEENQAEKELKEKLISEELNLINKNIKIEEWKIVNLPKNSLEPLIIEYKISSDKFFEKMGDLTFLSIFPLTEQIKQPFIAKNREYPIWYNNNILTTYEGTILLPQGFTIEDIPKQKSFVGLENVNYTFTCEKGPLKDRMALKTNLEISFPLILTKKDYHFFKDFYSSLCTLYKSKAIIKRVEND